MIFTSLSPNTEHDDVVLALRLLLQPWRWRSGEAARRLEEEMSQWLPARHLVSFESGRTSLFAILKALGIGSGDEVIIQAYTCVAVPEPIMWLGARPRYVDCDPTTLTMSAAGCAQKITPKTKAIIVQHTFGYPAEIRPLVELARARNIPIIEDCAHALGALYHGQHVGTFGDVSFFSFGRDKVISSVFGGMVATNDDRIGRALRAVQESFAAPKYRWIFRQLMHPIVLSFAKLTYGFLGLGKAVLALSIRFGIISRAVEEAERSGRMPSFVQHRMANALALLARHQFSKLERFNAHRTAIAAIYEADPDIARLAVQGSCREGERVYLRFAIQISDAVFVRRRLLKKGIELGDWYQEPVAPARVDYAAVGYEPGSAPVAEKIAARTVNLPTSIQTTEEDARRVITALNSVS